MQSSSGALSEDERQSLIECMQELTGRQLDYDVIEMVLSESNWRGNSQLSCLLQSMYVAHRYVDAITDRMHICKRLEDPQADANTLKI